MTVMIIDDDFPVKQSIREFERHCVTYLIHNDTYVYVGETSNLKTRLKDHQKVKAPYKLTRTKIIISEFFNKSAVYDIESRLINYLYADRPGSLINIKKEQSSHFYYLKEQINEQLFRRIWEGLKEYGLAHKNLEEIENSYLFKYSPFKELSLEQNNIVNHVIERVTEETGDSAIAPDGSMISLKCFKQEKERILISGGPGTGKTLLIVKIVHDLIKRYQVDGARIGVCIPQSNLHTTFKKMFRETKLKVTMVKPVDLSKVENDHFDFLIVDEAHRLKRHFSKQSKDLKHLGNGQTTELKLALSKAKHLVLMHDAHQTIRPADVLLSDLAALFDSRLTLTEQFRVKKGADYLRFIRQLLQIEDGSPSQNDIGGYSFAVSKSVTQMQESIYALEKQYGLCRIASGYYKPWISKTDPKAYDFADDGLKMRWNTTITGWIHSLKSPHEVGCIHTLQGEDLNYAGVIMGDEIWLDPVDGRIKISKEHYHDRNGTPVNETDPQNAALTNYIKHIYYVLLTRGMIGTFVFAKDKALRDYILKFTA